MTPKENLPGRVLITKIGLDGHDRGSRIIATYLRDAGMEVIYTSPWQTIESVVQIVLEEDVDLIGISSLATDHLIIPDLMRALADTNLGNVPVFVGGIIPKQEHPMLLEAGVKAIFGPGSRRDDIVSWAKHLTNESYHLKQVYWRGKNHTQPRG